MFNGAQRYNTNISYYQISVIFELVKLYAEKIISHLWVYFLDTVVDNCLSSCVDFWIKNGVLISKYHKINTEYILV